MKTFLVAYDLTTSHYYEVDARTQKEAIQKLKESPYGGNESDIRPDGTGDAQFCAFRVVEEVSAREDVG